MLAHISSNVRISSVFGRNKANFSALATKIPARSNGYTLYSRDHREALKVAEPNLSIGDIAKKLAAKWNGLTPEEQMIYKSKAIHMNTMAKAISQAQKTVESASAKKRPLSGFLCYAMAMRINLSNEPALSFTEMNKKIATSWKTLSEADKEKWKKFAGLKAARA